jgi:hypothetical protein
MGTIERCRDEISPKKFPNIAIIHQNIDRVVILPIRVCRGLLHEAIQCDWVGNERSWQYSQNGCIVIVGLTDRHTRLRGLRLSACIACG